MDYWTMFVLDIVKWFIILFFFSAMIGAYMRKAIFIAMEQFLGKGKGVPGQGMNPMNALGEIGHYAAKPIGEGLGKYVEAKLSGKK